MSANPPIDLLIAGSLTVEQAQEFSGLSRSFLYDAMDKKRLRWFKPGKDRLIVRSSLVLLLAELYAADPEPEAKELKMNQDRDEKRAKR